MKVKLDIIFSLKVVYIPLKCLYKILDYTQQKIVDCFKYRPEYQITVVDKNSKCQKKLTNYDFFWLEYEEIDFEKLASRNCKKLINSYCIRKGLIRKCQLAYYVKKCKKLNLYKIFLEIFSNVMLSFLDMTKRSSQLTKYLPETWIFELDYLDYIEESLNEVFEVEVAMRENLSRKDLNQPTKKFILKSSMTNKGNDILIFDTRQQLIDFFQNR